MELYYDSQPLHALGILGKLTQRFSPEPDPSKVARRRVTLAGQLTFHERNWPANRALVEQAKTIFAKTNGHLLWQDEGSGTKYADREVFLGDIVWPDTEKGGTFHQALTFELHWFEDTTDASMAATWTPTGGTTTTLSRVESVRESLGIERAHGLRPDRLGAGGSAILRGRYLPTMDDDLDDRMTVLQTTREAWITAFNVRDGTLVFGAGSFNRVVKVKSFQCEIAQDGMALDWTLDVEFSRFPDESNYFLCQYEIKESEQREQGQMKVTLSGKIGAQTLAAARSKLGHLRTLLTTRYTTGSYSGKKLTLEGAAESSSREFAGVTDAPVGVVDVTDAPAFHELTFSETYKVSGGDVTDWSLRLADDETPQQGQVRRSYSGTVGAKGSTFDAAYQTCVTKAKTLGADKHVVLVTGSIRALDNQQSTDYQGSGSDRFCRVEFEYVYQLKSASRVWIEVSSEVNLATFSVSTETVSGSVMATDAATARTAYNTIRGGYSSYLVENERVGERRVKVGKGSLTAGTTRTPPNAGSGWAAGVSGDINTTEVLDESANAESTSPPPQILNPPVMGNTYVRQWVGLTFSFNVVRPKTIDQTAVKYNQQTTTDYVGMLTTTTISGQVQAQTLAIANAVITALIPGGVQPLRREVTEETGQFWGTSPGFSSKVPSSAPAVYGYTFSVAWEARLTGVSTIVEASVSEEVDHSGANWVTQPTAFGRPVVQQCGYKVAGRTLQVQATAASESDAAGWCKKQWRLAFGSWMDGAPLGSPGSTSGGSDRWLRKNSSTITGYLNPPKFSCRAVFPKFTSAPAMRGTSNAHLFTVSMTATEIIPSADPTTESWT